MIYCKNTTKNHHLSCSYKGCLLSLNEMISKENKNRTCTLFDNSWIVLDLDNVEIQKAKKEGNRNRNATCDCSVGVDANNTKKMLLIECRLNYESANKITEKELDAKVRYSTSLMGQTPAILKTCYFVFKDKVKSQAFRKLRAMKSNKKEYIAVTTKELKNAMSA